MLPSKLFSYFPDHLSSQILHFPSLESLHGFLSPTVPFPSLHIPYPFRRPSSSLTTVSLGRNLPQFPLPLYLLFTSHLNYRCWYISCPISKDKKTWLSVNISPGAPGVLHIVDNKYLPFNSHTYPMILCTVKSFFHSKNEETENTVLKWCHTQNWLICSLCLLISVLKAASLLSSNMAPNYFSWLLSMNLHPFIFLACPDSSKKNKKKERWEILRQPLFAVLVGVAVATLRRQRINMGS